MSGEPGIGKTSLVEDFLAELTARPERPIVARGRCSERLAGAEAYLPILEALDSLLHRAGGESLQTPDEDGGADLVPAGGDAVDRGVVDGRRCASTR